MAEEGGEETGGGAPSGLQRPGSALLGHDYAAACPGGEEAIERRTLRMVGCGSA